MKQIQINQTSIGQQDYNLVEKVEKKINIFSPSLYKAIDLGLPSGTLWADRNIGAATSEDSGLYFQWGDTQGYTAEQVGVNKQFAEDYSDYKWYSDRVFTKYNTVDNKVTLDLEDDAAYVIMGSNWRMPTLEELKELCFNTDICLVPTEGEEIQGTAQEQSGGVMINWASQAEGTLKGVKFYKKGDKQTYMFVPESGSALDGSVQHVGEYGYLWTSSLYSSVVQNAWIFGFGARLGGIVSGDRYFGVPVRGIMSNI